MSTEIRLVPIGSSRKVTSSIRPVRPIPPTVARDGIPVTLITDNAAAALMQAGRVQWVITGADRVTANGDVINKIGTCSLAIIARHYGVRFMVAAPCSTLDPALADGAQVEIEQLKEQARRRDLGPPRLDPRANIPILLNFTDAEVRDRDYFYFGAFQFAALFIALGTGGLLRSVWLSVRQISAWSS